MESALASPNIEPAAAPEARRVARFGLTRRILAALLVYLAVRGFVLGVMGPVSFIDTPTYSDLFKDGFAGGFFGRTRPWGYPLVFWLAGQHFGLVAVAQRLAAGLAWFVLALALAGLFRTALARHLAFWGTLLFSLTLFSVIWDVFLLTESFSISLFVALTALAAWFLKKDSPALPLPGAMVVLALPFMGLRDSNTPLIYLLACGLAVTLAARGFRAGEPRPPRRGLWGGLALAGLLALTALFHTHDVRVSHRNWQSIANSLSYRAVQKLVVENNIVKGVPDEDTIAWLAERYGMPADEARARCGKTAYQDPPSAPSSRNG